MNLYARYTPWDQVLFTAGTTNVIDNKYRVHLAGINRVVNSGVALGQKIPGAGRNFFGRVTFRW